MAKARCSFLHPIFGAALFAVAGVSCTTTSSGSGSSGSTSGDQAATQPSDNGGETPPATACSGRGYFNTNFLFGFDPPAGYTGPIAAFGTDYSSFPVLHQAFTVPLAFARKIDIEVFSSAQSLGQWTATVRTQRLFAGYISQTVEDFTTDGGTPATLLVWTSTQNVIYETFSAHGSFIIALHAQVSLIDSAFVNSAYRTSMRTLCVEPVQ
jgi:hypothetical protein